MKKTFWKLLREFSALRRPEGAGSRAGGFHETTILSEAAEKGDAGMEGVYLNRELSWLAFNGRVLEEAERVTEDVRSYGSLLDARECEESGSFCHGDYQHHNLLCQNTTSVINFEKCALDSQMRDLYLFLRKLLEKTNWSVPLARGLLDVYGRISPLSAVDYLQLYYRFAYPEKFWKIVNFYYNSRKVWIPGRHMEKLERLLIQQGVKKAFLEQTFSL